MTESFLLVEFELNSTYFVVPTWVPLGQSGQTRANQGPAMPIKARQRQCSSIRASLIGHHVFTIKRCRSSNNWAWPLSLNILFEPGSTIDCRDFFFKVVRSTFILVHVRSCSIGCNLRLNHFGLILLAQV